NALELVEVMQVLCEGKAGRLRELTLQLGGELLCANRLFKSFEAAQEDLANRLDSGQAAEKFGQMIALMGGPRGFVENWQRFLPEAPVIREIYAAREGYITAWDSEALGLSVVQLGGGRQVESDIIDPSVGLSDVLPIGSKVIAGMPVARVHANRVGLADKIGETVRNALSMGEIALPAAPLVLERVG
ncbi:thymidine phosphorylase, partial [Paracoccaceae bacterium]|nr:thymidine phosphorylase [Paracoccaceae bacterium]